MVEISVQAMGRRPRPSSVGVWLLIMAAMVVAMMVLGGVTRLTHSGLSIVDWRPIMGTLPPLGEMAWQETFASYKHFPEYRQINAGMTLDEFKAIFWFEYSHRLLGRAIGVLFMAPFLIFLAMGRIERALVPRLLVIFVMGGLQGLLGWFMVQSGLVDRPDVSQYRLTAHLGLAFLIYGYIIWVALDYLRTPMPHPAQAASAFGTWLRLLVFWILFVVLTGGLVAGTDAGFAYNTFPLMDGAWVPAGLIDQTPWVLNFLENRTTIQFDHRILAILTAVFVGGLWLSARRQPLSAETQRAIHYLAIALILQFTLGLLTLLLAVPVAIAALHQLGAVILFSAAIYAAHNFRRFTPQARPDWV